MHSLKSYWLLSGHPMPNGAWDGNVACIVYDAKQVLKANETRGFLAGYGFCIVTRGSMTIIYNNREMSLQEGDLYTYSPGFEIRIISVSNDFRCLSLLADEHFALSLPSVRDAIRMAHFPLVELTAPILPIQGENRRRLLELMQMMMHYQQAGLPQMNESLKMLFNLFLLDLSAIQSTTVFESASRKSFSVSSICCHSILPSTTTSVSTPSASALLRHTSHASYAKCQVAAPSLTISISCCSWRPCSSCARLPSASRR